MNGEEMAQLSGKLTASVLPDRVKNVDMTGISPSATEGAIMSFSSNTKCDAAQAVLKQCKTHLRFNVDGAKSRKPHTVVKNVPKYIQEGGSLGNLKSQNDSGESCQVLKELENKKSRTFVAILMSSQRRTEKFLYGEETANTTPAIPGHEPLHKRRKAFQGGGISGYV